jgi:hypothetical protein
VRLGQPLRLFPRYEVSEPELKRDFRRRKSIEAPRRKTSQHECRKIRTRGAFERRFFPASFAGTSIDRASVVPRIDGAIIRLGSGRKLGIGRYGPSQHEEQSARNASQIPAEDHAFCGHAHLESDDATGPGMTRFLPTPLPSDCVRVDKLPVRPDDRLCCQPSTYALDIIGEILLNDHPARIGRRKKPVSLTHEGGEGTLRRGELRITQRAP